MRIAILGVGLIGGSIALAARTRLGAAVVGWDADPGAATRALERGALDLVAPDLPSAVRGAEVVFACVPVKALPAVVGQALRNADADAVVTDVGSTKRGIVDGVEDERFVGGHPLAGAETSGIEHARADLFESSVWYLTPTERTAGLRYERLHRLLVALGARPQAIEAEAHDTVLAVVSHLPHVLANVLVAQAARALAAEGERLPASGPSFRDATRVAGAPSSIWLDIYLSNRDALGEQIDETIRRLAEVRGALRDGDAATIRAWNEAGAQHRRELVEAEMGGGELAELRVSVPNRPGVIARIALELGRAGVSIADLAVYPAPDMSEGVVALWTAGDQLDRARRTVAGLGFPAAPA
jgi:prephenate dehydrogenase